MCTSIRVSWGWKQRTACRAWRSAHGRDGRLEARLLAEDASTCLCADAASLSPPPPGATVLWKHIIQRHGGFITSTLNISCLAKVSDGFTQGHIVQAVKGVLTERRVRQQSQKPLVALEFIAALSHMDPVYQEEEDSFKVNRAHAVSVAKVPVTRSLRAPAFQDFALCRVQCNLDT